MAARLLFGAVLAASLFGAGFYLGHSVRGARADRERASALEAQQKLLIAEKERGDALAKKLVEATQRRGARRGGYRAAADQLAGCSTSMPADLVWLHNAAAADRDVPKASGINACAPSGVAADTVARVVTDNYAACHDIRDQLNALIDWTEQQHGG